MNDEIVLCACGLPLHYTNPETEALMRMLVARLGEYVTITVPGSRRYRVQRHYIALHGITAQELLAQDP